MTAEIDFSRPCAACVDGRHGDCDEAMCGCIAQHAADEPLMRGFKALKRQLHPERESWTAGGWS